MGFAPPPRDGFAILAAAHECACPATFASYTGSQPHAIPPGGEFPQMEDAPVLLYVTLSPSHARLVFPVGDGFRMHSWRNYLELRRGGVHADGSTTP
jgi:hypothetical protein